MTSILSGGNQQRLIVHREALVAKAAFVAVHPSRGLDVHATQDVQAALLAARDGGCAVLLISDDLDEVLLISDRIAVMYEGRVVGVFDRRARRSGAARAPDGRPLIRGRDRPPRRTS